MNKKWYNIQGKATDAVAEVYIFDEIGAYGITAQDFIAEMKEYKGTPVNLRINCIEDRDWETSATASVALP